MACVIFGTMYLKAVCGNGMYQEQRNNTKKWIRLITFMTFMTDKNEFEAIE